MSKEASFLLILPLAATLVAVACSHQRPTPEALLKEGAAQMRSVISEAVTDPIRRDQLLERADRLAGDLAAYSADYEAFIDRLHRANRDYDTPPEQIKTIFTQFEEKRQASRAQLLELHFQMRGLTSEEERKHIARAEIQMLEAIGALPPGSPVKKGD